MTDGLAAFRVEPDRSQVWIEARSTLHPIHGEAGGLEGRVEAQVAGGALDASVPPKAIVSLPVDRLSSGNALQDLEMRRRIEAARFPSITAELREVTSIGPPGRYRAWVDLTFHGVTRRIPADVTVSLDAAEGSLAIDGRSELDVRGFGVTPPRLLGLQVHPEIEVRIRVIARQEG